MRDLTQNDILRALAHLGIVDGYRDTSSYEALVATAALPMPARAELEAALSELDAPPALDIKKPVLLVAIDAEAERQRLRWITPGAGQAMTYQRKVEEAYRLEADGEPVSENYPMLSATVGIDGDTLQAVGELVRAKDAFWSRIGGAIEARRLLLKRQVSEATDPAALNAINISSGWPEKADVG